MKKILKVLVLALAVALGCGTASAQLRFGIKAGANFNSFHVTEWQNAFGAFDKDNGCGVTAGVMTEFTVPVIGLCFDASLMYTHMSATLDVTNPEGIATAIKGEASSKNFFSIPVNVKYRFGMVPVAKPFIFTGPEFAFKFGGKNDVFKTRTFQTAWNIGVGAELLDHVQIAASYGIGMNNIFKHVAGENTGFTEDFKLKNNYWTITAAYLF